MRIIYTIINGEALNFSFKEDNYTLLSDEYHAEGANEITDVLVESYHSSDFKSQRDIKIQKNACIALLSETDYKVSSDFAYPNDKAVWETYRQNLRDIITNAVITTIPDKPF